MKKQIVGIIITCVVLMALMVMLSSCGESNSLSGKYVNAGDNTEYLEFSGKNSFELYKNGKMSMYGSYKISGDILTLSFDLGSSWSDLSCKLNKSKNTIYFDGTSYIKGGTDAAGNIVEEKGFWAKHWPKFVIGFIVLGVIGMIYNKVTGRDLGDDIENLGDRIDDAMDGSDKDEKTK